MKKTGTQKIALFALLILAAFASPALAGSGMLATQQDASPTVPRYTLWDGAAWSGLADANAVAGNVQWVVLKSNPVRNETVLATLDTANRIEAQVWNGSQWGSPVSMTNSSSATANRAYDVAFERESGNAVVIYGAGTAGQVQYRTWNGSAWSAATNLTVGGTGQIQWVRLMANPLRDYNKLMLATMDDNNAGFATPYNGTQWLSPQSLGLIQSGAAATFNTQAFDISFEQTSGDALVVWANTTSGAPYYATYSNTTGTWSAVGQGFDGGSATITNIQLATANASDRIMMCYIEGSAGDLDCQAWSGTAWGTGGARDISIEYSAGSSYRNFDVAESTSTGGFLVAYGDSGIDFAAGYQCTSAANCAANTWSAAMASPFGATDLGVDTAWISLVADTSNANGDIIGLFRGQTTSASYFKGVTRCTAGGCATQETSNTLGTATTSNDFDQAMFALDRFSATLAAPTFSNTTDLDVGKNNSQDNATVTCNVSCAPGQCAQLTIGLQSNATGSFVQFSNDANASSNETGGSPAFYNCGSSRTCSRTWQIEGLSNTTFYLRCFANTTTVNAGSPTTSATAGRARIYAGKFTAPVQSPSTTQDVSIYDTLSLSGSVNCTAPTNANASCGASTLTALTNDTGGAPNAAISAGTQLMLQSGSNSQPQSCWTGTAGFCTLNFSAITANATYGNVSANGVARNWTLQATSTDAQVTGINGTSVAIRGHVGQANVTLLSSNLSGSSLGQMGSMNASVGCPAAPAYRCVNVSAWPRYNVSASVDTPIPTSGDPATVPLGYQPQIVSLLAAGASTNLNWTLTAGSGTGRWLYGFLLNSTVGGFADQVSATSNFRIRGHQTNLSIWDQGDPQGGGLATLTDDNILFYANYSNYSNGAPLNSGSSCQINFSDAPNTFNNMSYNGSIYNYSRVFATPAAYNYNVNCTKAGYDDGDATGNVNITQAPTVNTSQTSYSNCGAVYYRVNLYQSNGTLWPSATTTQINLTNSTGSLQQSFNTSITGGQYNSSFALNTTGGTGAWFIRALAGALGVQKFRVGEGGAELWKLDLDLSPDKANYSAASSITLNFTIWNQRGVGVASLNTAANITIYNDSIAIPGTSVSNLGGGNYSYVFSTSGVASGSHYLEVSATTGTRNISMRRGYSIG
ncbi:MAG: hypothetical protein WC792_00080 [Candidatus Micrarchaeia archaeon]|jgi:hypothetical protein